MKKQNKAKIGSSETTREAFVFNLDQVLPSFTPLTREEMEKKRTFLEWLIGFIEGDGSFALQKIPTLKNPRNSRPSLQINQKEPEVLYKIKKALGFGIVIPVTERKTGSSYYRYSVYKLCHVKQLIALLNGNLLLHKVEKRFANWVTAYNSLCDQRAELSLLASLAGGEGTSPQSLASHASLTSRASLRAAREARDARDARVVGGSAPHPPDARDPKSLGERYLLQQDLGEKITLKQSAIELDLNSAWLAGFTDAEGGFYASLSASKRHATGFRERLKFYITQKGERQLLQKINALVQAVSVEKLAEQLSPAAIEKACHCAASLDADASNAKPRYCERCLHAFLCQSSHIGAVKAEIHRLELTRRPNLEVLVDYFDRYPLLTKKRLVFARWRRLLLRGDAIKQAALGSEKGMRRYIKLYASVGRIRQSQNRDQD